MGGPSIRLACRPPWRTSFDGPVSPICSYNGPTTRSRNTWPTYNNSSSGGGRSGVRNMNKKSGNFWTKIPIFLLKISCKSKQKWENVLSLNFMKIEINCSSRWCRFYRHFMPHDALLQLWRTTQWVFNTILTKLIMFSFFFWQINFKNDFSLRSWSQNLLPIRF